MKYSGLTKRLWLNKWIIVPLIFCVALCSVGVTYARWNGNHFDGRMLVETEQCHDPFTWAATNDDGHLDYHSSYNDGNDPVDPGDDWTIPGEYDYWADVTSSSNDPGAVQLPEILPPPAPGDAFPRYTKDVARTTAVIDPDDDTLLYVTVDNAYPYYYSTVFFALACDPPVDGTIIDIVLEGVDETALDVDYTLIAPGYPIPGDGEGVVGALHIFVKQEALQLATYTFTLSIETECADIACDETAYAYHPELATCFNEFGFSSWGWTNGPFGPGCYTMPIYAGVGGCVPANENLIGTLYVKYDGFKVYVKYDLDEGYSMDGTHLYVGTDPLPTKNGEPTVSPGQYGNQHSFDTPVTEDSYTIYGFSGQPIYIIAHAVVCGWD